MYPDSQKSGMNKGFNDYQQLIDYCKKREIDISDFDPDVIYDDYD